MRGRKYEVLVEAHSEADALIGVLVHYYTNGSGGWFYFRTTSSDAHACGLLARRLTRMRIFSRHVVHHSPPGQPPTSRAN
ncbi:MAG TPA: hypothetical protein QGF35_05190 [Dehalococcoidia bacterium]|nr:hypothetical protein [Dehalococcoidia bacterium]